jgi:hypothetical protein
MQGETTALILEPVAHDVYEAPRVERVMTREELAREIQYAGDVGGSGPPG